MLFYEICRGKLDGGRKFIDLNLQFFLIEERFYKMVLLIVIIQMMKIRQQSKKQKPQAKIALSTLNLKKVELPKDINVTYRPKYVQKQWKENNEQAKKKSFFNRTQNAQTINRSLEKHIETQPNFCYQNMKSKTPSPLREKYMHQGNILDDQRIIEKLFGVKKKNNEDAVVENLIMNILGNDQHRQSPEATIKKVNKQIAELRLKNIRLEKQLKEVKSQNLRLVEKLNVSMKLNPQMEQFLLSTFELILIIKTMESCFQETDQMLPLLYKKSQTTMIKLNPLVIQYDIQKILKQKGLELKQQLSHRERSRNSQSSKYPLVNLIKMLNQQDTPQVKKTSLKEISTSVDSNSKTYKSSRTKGRDRSSNSLIVSADIIQEQLLEEDLTFDNLRNQNNFEYSQNTVICHHSKDVSYGGMIEDKQKEDVRVDAVVLQDFSGDNDNDLPLKRGEKIHILKKTNNGWWIGMHDNVVGYFPAKNVRIES